MMNSKDTVILVENLSKTYQSGFEALKEINLKINRGEILALLGPNGAGKTTLISIICGIVNASKGRILVDGYDIVKDYRKSRAKIGLVPQELTNDLFEKVLPTLRFSRGLFGKEANEKLLEKIIKDLSLWDKRDQKIVSLSGGMKRRVMIAKALAHEPEILFLDEPTAGVDVELRREMWQMVKELKAKGVTIILTTHYIEEAEEIADRIAIINQGKIVILEEKATLLKKMGSKSIRLKLNKVLSSLPENLKTSSIEIRDNGKTLIYNLPRGENKINLILTELVTLGIEVEDIVSEESSLEEIFVNFLTHQNTGDRP